MLSIIKSKLLFYSITMLCCEEIEVINKLISLYQRPITVLGITQDESTNIPSLLAQQHPNSVFILLNSQELKNDNHPNNFIKLSSSSDSSILEHLGECEHIDIVYVSNVKQPLKAQIINSLHNVGENVIISVSNKDQFNQTALREKYFQELEKKDKYSYFLSTKRITFLRRNQWLELPSVSNAVRYIESSYTKKLLYKMHMPDYPPSEWIPGINLMTFKALNGSIPSIVQLKDEISSLFKTPHLDCMPNNIIIQGSKLAFIDFDPVGSEPKTVQTPAMLNLLQQFVGSKREEIIHNFNQILTYCREQLHPLRSPIDVKYYIKDL